MRLNVPWDNAEMMSGIPRGVMIVGKVDENFPELLFENEDRLEEVHTYAFNTIKYTGYISVNQFLTYLDFPDGGVWGSEHGWISLPVAPNIVKDYYMGAYRLVMPDPVELFKSRVVFKKPTFEEFIDKCNYHYEDNPQHDIRQFFISYKLPNGVEIKKSDFVPIQLDRTNFDMFYRNSVDEIFKAAYEKVLAEIDKLNEEDNKMPYSNQTGSLNLNNGMLYYSHNTTTNATTCGFNGISLSDIPDFIMNCCCSPNASTPKTETKKANTPKVVKVETYNDRVVKVTFDDGTFTKSVCSENDHFDLDVGITICIMKKILGNDNKNGTRLYNNLIRKVHDVMRETDDLKAEEQAKKQEEKAKKRKEMLRKAAKKVKKRQEQIDIQKTAFVEAMREIKNSELEDDLK